jgi:hypothetical protein
MTRAAYLITILANNPLAKALLPVIAHMGDYLNRSYFLIDRELSLYIREVDAETDSRRTAPTADYVCFPPKSGRLLHPGEMSVSSQKRT